MLKEPATIWMEEVDSTNNEMRRRMDSLGNLSVIAARQQSSGRGQGSHVWLSETGANLTFSLLLRYGKEILPAPELRKINDYITDVLLRVISEEQVTARVKPPNDIWVSDRKICGILIENILEGSFIRESIVGIGFNLNQTEWPDSLPNPVSLCELTGKKYPPERMLERISDCCKKNWSRYFTRPEVP